MTDLNTKLQLVQQLKQLAQNDPATSSTILASVVPLAADPEPVIPIGLLDVLDILIPKVTSEAGMIT